MKLKGGIGNAIKTIALPAAVYLIMYLLNLAAGKNFFASQMGTMSILRETVATTILAYGAFYNLNSGRFDFSLGSVWLVAGIVSFNWAAQLQCSPWIMLLMSVAVGVVLSVIIAIVYILLKSSAIVVCLGMLLVYESISTVLFNGAGVSISRYQAANLFGNTGVMIAIFAVVFLAIYVLNNYTSFGYHTRALATGQKAAVSVGIREKRNVILCWAISGACAGIAVMFEIVSVGIITPHTNFASSATLVDVLLPVFLGAFWARYSENTIGVLVATLSVQILKVGLNGLQIDPNLQSILNIMCLLLFILYSSYKNEAERNRSLKARAEAIAKETAII